MNITSAKIADVKNWFKSARGFVGMVLMGFAIVGLLYLFYWVCLMSDDFIYEYTGSIFSPLASLLFPNDNTYDIYKNTGILALVIIAPLSTLYWVCDKLEDTILNIFRKINEMDEASQTKKAMLEGLRQYEEIKSYSICISIDIESKKTLNKASIQELVYKSIKLNILKICPLLKVASDSVLIIKSDDFIKYDSVYEEILKSLAKSKTLLEKKYNLEIIPSITTDAYKQEASNVDIKRHHFDIMGFNFKNRSCTSALFAKKYKYLQREKYAGVPVGDFSHFEKGGSETYELNIVYKNLSRALTAYGLKNLA